MEGKNPVNELIDVRILRLLGLLDVFDLDYDTYKTLLRELLVEVDRSKVKIPTEEIILLQEELKRIRRKTGRFKPKKKRPINSNNVSNLNSFGKKLLKGTASQTVPKQGKSTAVSEGLLDIVKSIRKAVESIHNTVQLQSGILRGQGERDRRTRENERRQREEGRLEEKKNGLLETAKKIVAPFESIFDRIVKFLVFTILGRAFKVFMDWASDPKNKDKVATLWKFLKDWWPALLGGWFLFATPLGKFTRTIVGTVAKLSLKLAKFAIPKLLAFTKSHPLIAAGAVTGIAAGAGFMMEQGRMDDIAKQQGTQPEKRGQGDWFSEIGKAFNPGQLGMGGASLLNRGGSVFSGIVDQYTGTKVSGAGPDTQFFPIEGGGGAVLQPGEAVLQVGARERMVNELGVDPLAYNIGSNANKPRTLSSNILGSANGGLVALQGGGIIGGAKKIVGMGRGVENQCANTTRAALKASGNMKLANKITKRGDLDIPKGITKFTQNPEMAASLAGSDLGKVIKSKSEIKSGDLLFWKADRDKGQDVNKGAVTHVGIAADDGLKNQYDHNKSKGWHYRPHWHSSEGTSWFAGIRLTDTNSKASSKNTGKSVYKQSSGTGWAAQSFRPAGTNTWGGDARSNNKNFNIGQKNNYKSNSSPASNSLSISYQRPNLKVPSPPSQKGGVDMITLPPITQSLGGSGSSGSANRGSNVSSFSVVSGAAMATRNANADLYGIV
jgi:hypothetical protein